MWFCSDWVSTDERHAALNATVITSRVVRHAILLLACGDSRFSCMAGIVPHDSLGPFNEKLNGTIARADRWRVVFLDPVFFVAAARKPPIGNQATR